MQRIVEEEQKGELRAHYGSYLLKNLALKLETEYGSGFSLRLLERARQFYRAYPIASALRPQLNWSQYKMLISIDDEGKREYYECESVRNSWTGRELELLSITAANNRSFFSVINDKADSKTSFRWS